MEENGKHEWRIIPLDKEASELLAGNGMLIKRPLVLDNGVATFGFKEEVYEEKWK